LDDCSIVIYNIIYREESPSTAGQGAL